MTQEKKYELARQLVEAALEDKPAEVADLVKELLVEKCSTAIKKQKKKMAKKMWKEEGEGEVEEEVTPIEELGTMSKEDFFKINENDEVLSEEDTPGMEPTAFASMHKKLVKKGWSKVQSTGGKAHHYESKMAPGHHIITRKNTFVHRNPEGKTNSHYPHELGKVLKSTKAE